MTLNTYETPVETLNFITIRENGGYLKSIARWREQITDWKPMLVRR
jgi:hypothetical protein